MEMNIVLVLCLLVLLFKRGYPSVLRTTVSTSYPSVLRTTVSTNEKVDVAKECSGKKPGLYPYPKNCSVYVSCDGEENSSVKVCKPHNNFHPVYQVCVWDQIYLCSGSISNETSLIIQYCRQKAAGVYKDPQRCDSYVICSKEGVYHMKCPPAFLFNSVTNKCDNDVNVHCNGSNIDPVRRMMTTSTSSPVSSGRTTKTVYSADIRSSTTNIPISFSRRGTTITSTSTEVANPTFSCEGRNPGKYAVSHACQYFYLCKGKGEVILKKCPKHTNFQPVYRNCVWTYVYSCDDPNFCEGKSDGKYQNENNCYGYYQCAGQRTFPRNCDPGLRFNGNDCVDASQYVCPKSPIGLNVVQ